MKLALNRPMLHILISALAIFVGSCSPYKKILVTNSALEKATQEHEAIAGKQKEKELRSTQTARSIKQDEESTLKIMQENAPKVRLNEYFNAIAYADNAANANNTIAKALAMFSSTDTPVLMVIRESNGKIDYGEPTTIIAYFNSLKDRKNNFDDIKNLKVNAAGKITQVELKKNN